MTSAFRIPPLLVPYFVSPPKDSLILLTSTLGTSANWILTRHLCSALGSDAAKGRRTAGTLQYKDLAAEGPGGSEKDNGRDVDGEEYAVVLVSWMRDWEFWRLEARRAAGLDLAQLSQNHRFVFVDGLSGLFSVETPASKEQALPTREAPLSSTTILGRRPISTRHIPASTRAPGPADGAAPAPTLDATSQTQRTSHSFNLTSIDLAHTRTILEEAIASLATTNSTQPSTQAVRRIILILDAPDILSSLQPPTTATPPTSLQSLLFNLRLNPSVYSTVVSLSSDINAPPSDLPPGHIPSPLDINTPAFLVGMAHEADLVLGCRGLDTGGAGDVSGVIRITKGSTSYGEDVNKEWREQELLYLVSGDGNVKVWERGAGVG